MNREKVFGAKHSFLWALLLASLVFLPFIIYNGGIFVYMGDYNVQQIPFYQLCHESVKNGELLWNWNTDLGANFIGSYSFYLLFSPFFWLTLLFPTSFVPYLLGPLLILKTALAALTSYFYIKRFVSDKAYAVLGSILYAFSGFMIFNIFFNHFHDVVVFFPLLLLSLDELCENNRHGFFAFMVAVSAVVNYWFFIGEVVFVIIYVFVRMATDKNWQSAKKFVEIAFESILGVGIAAFVLLPSVLAITGNPRTGADELLKGQLLWIYGFQQRLPAIIQSFFFPPEIPSRPTFFPDMGAKWASLSAWIPVFSTVGTIAFCKYMKKNTVKRIIVVSMIMSLVPVFNSAFVLFNDSYYARWFYMPILFLCIATVVVLERREEMAEEIKSAFYWTSGFTLAFIAAIGLSPKKGEGESTAFGLYKDGATFWCFSLVAIICIILCAMLFFVFKDSKNFTRISSLMMSVVIVVFSLGYFAEGKSSKSKDNKYLDTLLNGRDNYVLPGDEFYRTDFYNCEDNMGMILGYPTIQAFHSIVPPSIMEFYPFVGIKRDVSSKPPVSHDALRPLVSVKYLFVKADDSTQEPMEGYTLFDTQKGYNIYENNNFIPMGFLYNSAIDEEALKDLSGEQKLRYMISSMVLTHEGILRNSDILKHDKEADYSYLSNEMLLKAIENKKENCANYFERNKNGFTASIKSGKESLLFFSVPYDKGWTAYVNGEKAIVEKANVGFMAVRVPRGESEIRFEYMTPGLILGFNISAVSAALLIVYLLFMLKFSGVIKNISDQVNGRKRTAVKSDEKVFLDKALNGIESIEELSDNKPDKEDLITPDDIKKDDLF